MFYIADAGQIIRIPPSATFGEYLTFQSASPGLIVSNFKTSNQVLGIIFLFLFTVASFRYSRYLGLASGLTLVLYILVGNNDTRPIPNASWSTYLTLPQLQLNKISKLSQEILSNSFQSSSHQRILSSSSVPGITTETLDTTLELSSIDPFTATPVHTHSHTVYAVALEDGLEIQFLQNWRPWKKGQVLCIAANISHSVRNTTDSVISFISGSKDETTSALQDILI